ncbi:MAG: phosphoribosylformylglycinamidine synthase I [Endomicrobium sp.]|jgi:phosphoribosylformylglycinamidine synthase|nr:phosphoribosylformylglycinamidine synthase I [Endomicrobium sp.]
MKKNKVLILRTAGTNCDYETQSAFELCGIAVERVHISVLIENKSKIFEYDILVFPGGFSYGDDVASGKVLSNEIKNKLGSEVRKFALSGKPIIGICNGFQVLVKIGLLPDPELFTQVSTFSHNDYNKFECRWVYLKTGNKINNESNCIWTNKLPTIVSLPIAHGEGKFIPKNKSILNSLNKNNQIVFRYSSKDGNIPRYPLDPNGSVDNIAGICNKKGNVFGLMPHPERYIFHMQHPSRKNFTGKNHGWGKIIFQNAVDFVNR